MLLQSDTEPDKEPTTETRKDTAPSTRENQPDNHNGPFKDAASTGSLSEDPSYHENPDNDMRRAMMSESGEE